MSLAHADDDDRREALEGIARVVRSLHDIRASAELLYGDRVFVLLMALHGNLWQHVANIAIDHFLGHPTSAVIDFPGGLRYRLTIEEETP